MDVDWTKPIEAVHEDGTVQPATNMGGGYVSIGGSSSWWSTDSKGDILSTRWKLRNVQPAAAKPSEIDAGLVERMVALVRDLAGRISEPGDEEIMNAEPIPQQLREARAIVAELPEPVDADLLEAREICFKESFSDNRDESSYLRGGLDNSLSMRCALAAIKRGRALEREGK